MTPLSWLYMGLVWIVILIMNIFCFTRIFSRNNKKDTEQPGQDSS
jgi:hypothetical protein